MSEWGRGVIASHEDHMTEETSGILAGVWAEWRGLDLWWGINGEWISDRDLRNWCANNMDGPGRYVGAVLRCHIQAYAERDR
jgi:hypothetical protein